MSNPTSIISETAKLRAAIGILTLLIKIGKWLPYIVLAFACANLTFGILDFLIWSNMLGGIFNSILAFGGFSFFGQLSRGRKIHGYEYNYKGRNPRRIKEDEIENLHGVVPQVSQA